MTHKGASRQAHTRLHKRACMCTHDIIIDITYTHRHTRPRPHAMYTRAPYLNPTILRDSVAAHILISHKRRTHAHMYTPIHHKYAHRTSIHWPSWLASQST